jgi:hypothetical protein
MEVVVKKTVVFFTLYLQLILAEIQMFKSQLLPN